MRIAASTAATALLALSASTAAIAHSTAQSASSSSSLLSSRALHPRAAEEPPPGACAAPGTDAKEGARAPGSCLQRSSTGPPSTTTTTTDIHLEKSHEATRISLGKVDRRDPRSLRFQSGVFRSSTGKTGASAYNLGIRPRELLAYERRPPSSAGTAAQASQYAPSPAPAALRPGQPGAADADVNGASSSSSSSKKGKAGAHHPSATQAAAHPAAAAAATTGASHPPLPFFPYSTSPMLSDADYRLPTFASKPRYRSDPPRIGPLLSAGDRSRGTSDSDAGAGRGGLGGGAAGAGARPGGVAGGAEEREPVPRAKPRHKLMSKLAWNRLPSWSRVLLEDAITILNVPDAQGKVRRRSRSPLTGKWWRWAYGRGWIYGWSRDWSALESGRGPGVALAHLLPDRQVWTATPPRLHWRFVMIVSIAIPTFFGLFAALFLVQWLFFPHTLDFSSPVGDKYIYVGLPTSDAGSVWGPTLPFSHSNSGASSKRKAKGRSRPGSDESNDVSIPLLSTSTAAAARPTTPSGSGSGSAAAGAAAPSVAVVLGTGAEPGVSHLLLTRRSPNFLRGRRNEAAAAAGSASTAGGGSGWDHEVEMGETMVRGGGGGGLQAYRPHHHPHAHGKGRMVRSSSSSAGSSLSHARV